MLIQEFRHINSGSLTLVSLAHTCRDHCLDFFLNAHHNGFLPMQLEVVWNLLLQGGSEGPTLISCAVTHTLYILKCARGALAGVLG
jgi:hypothetical protein